MLQQRPDGLPNEPIIPYPKPAAALGGLGALGRMVKSVGALAGLGTIDLAPGITFQNDAAFNDFVRGVSLRGSAGTWPGLDAQIQTQLRQAVTTAGSSLSFNSLSLLEGFKTRAQDYASQLDQLEHWDNIFGRSDAHDASYKQVMSLLKQEIMSFLQSYNSSTQTAQSGGMPGANTPVTNTGVTQAPPVPAAVDQLNANVLALINSMKGQGAANAPAQQAPDTGPSPLLIFGGLGAAALVAYLLLKKKG